MSIGIENLASMVGSSDLDGKVKLAFSEADKAWKAARAALRRIDFENDAEKGEQELRKLLLSLKVWIARTGMIANAAETIRTRAAQVL